MLFIRHFYIIFVMIKFIQSTYLRSFNFKIFGIDSSTLNLYKNYTINNSYLSEMECYLDCMNNPYCKSVSIDSSIMCSQYSVFIYSEVNKLTETSIRASNKIQQGEI